MSKKHVRILPLGFAVSIVILLLVILSLAILVRNNSAPDKLYYTLNKDSEFKTYSAFFSLTTLGDAVNYQQKSYQLKYNVTTHKDYMYIKAIPNEDTETSPIEMYLTDKKMYYKNTKMLTYAVFPYYEFDNLFEDIQLNLDQLISITDWNSPSFKEIISSNRLQIKTSFNKVTEFAESSKKDIIVKFDIDTLFTAIEEVAKDMMLHEAFESEILTRVSKIYDLYSQNAIIKHLNLDSTIMFANLVDWKTNFEATLFTRIDEYKSTLKNTFTDESNFTLHFTIDQNQIVHISFNGELKYRSCDASEQIEWTYSRLAYHEVDSPKNFETQIMSPYYDIFNSHFDYKQK